MIVHSCIVEVAASVGTGQSSYHKKREISVHFGIVLLGKELLASKSGSKSPVFQ